MVRKLVIAVFIVALGASFTEIRAAAAQSLHFNVSAPAAAGILGSPPSDDLRVSVNATDLPNINTGPIDLVSGDSSELVSRKAAKAVCVRAFQHSTLTCIRTTGGGGGSCATGTSCCDDFLTSSFSVDVACSRGVGTAGFDLTHPPNTAADFISATPGTAPGNITNLIADNSRVYTDIGIDIAANGVSQTRRNGLTGTTHQRFLVQGNPTPFDAIVNVDSTMNDDSEDAVYYAALKTAIENLPITPRLIVTIRDNTAPTGYDPSGYIKQGPKFITIENILGANITEMQIAVPVGMGFTIGGSDVPSQALGPNKVPTLSTWGMVVLVIVLLFSGYVLMRRQRAGAATT